MLIVGYCSKNAVHGDGYVFHDVNEAGELLDTDWGELESSDLVFCLEEGLLHAYTGSLEEATQVQLQDGPIESKSIYDSRLRVATAASRVELLEVLQDMLALNDE